MDTYGPIQPDGLQETTLNIKYLPTLLDLEPTSATDDEATEIAWFPLDPLPHNLAFPIHVIPALEAARRLAGAETDRHR